MNKFLNKKGFTLIEAMIALGIFSIGFLAVATMQVNALNLTTSSRRTTEAMELALRQTEVLRALPFYPDYVDDSLTPAERFVFAEELKAGLHQPPSSPENGIYRIEWEVTDNEPLDPIPNVYTSPLPPPNEITIAKTINICVYETRNPGRIVANLEMVKVWEQDG